MVASNYSAIAELNGKRKLTPSRPQNQVAVVGLLPGILGDVLASMSRAGRKLPKSVPGYGALPPGDVVNIHHYTPQMALEALDPAKWSQRGGYAQNKESQWVGGNPELYQSQAYLPDYGYRNENLWGANPQRIEGAVPGMYNATEDPAGLWQIAKGKIDAERAGGLYPPTPPLYKQAFAREVQQRGYTGAYAPEGAAQGGTASLYDIVATGKPGTYPNIAQLRQNLNLPNDPGEGLFQVNDPVATVTTETMPGKVLTPHRYRLYDKDPAAAWLLHRDYERLLRNPDTSSVVANYMDMHEGAPVYQGAGYYKGQSNPMSGARVPQTDESLNRPMTRGEREKMNAVAVVEGVLRDQDAAAWARPRDLSQVPKEGDTSVLLKGKAMGSYELKQVAQALEGVTIDGKYTWSGQPELATEVFPVVPNPSGGPGVFVFNSVPHLPQKEFERVLNSVISTYQQKWKDTGSTDFEPLWGKHDSGYIESKDYNSVLSNLPTALKKNAERALQDLSPAVQEIRNYHDLLRGGSPPMGVGHPGSAGP